MRAEVIPDADHVSRLCGGSHVREDGTIAPTAFKPPRGEAYLSVNWLEHLRLQSRMAEVGEVFRVFATKRKIGSAARLAVLNVGAASMSVKDAILPRTEISFCREPEMESGRPQDASLSGIHGVPEDDNLIAELLAEAVLEVHSPA